MADLLQELEESLFLSEGGLETELVFIDGIDLPDFAPFPMLETPQGRDRMSRYYGEYVGIARRDGRGVIFETPTWRANPDWASGLGYTPKQLDQINQQSVKFLKKIQQEHASTGPTILVSGNLGPRGDGYMVGETMSPAEAAEYHRPQVESFATAGADLVTILTATYAEEAAGVAIAAQAIGLASVVSFTVETDGTLPSGQSLANAINQIDTATDGAVAYYMINCAHPSHFINTLRSPGPWHRIRGIRANASKMSHEELDASTKLDRGDELELAQEYVALSELLPELSVVGGCCGTDSAHIDAISTGLAHL